MLTDGTAATEKRHHEAAITMVSMQGCIFGATITSSDMVAALRPYARLIRYYATLLLEKCRDEEMHV